MMNLQTLTVTNAHLIMSCVLVNIQVQVAQVRCEVVVGTSVGVPYQWRVMWLQQRLVNQVEKPWVLDSVAQNDANKPK
jgi:hypothetical protein